MSRFRKRPYRRRRTGRVIRRWDYGEDQYLFKHYLTLRAVDIGKRLDRTKNAVVARANKLGLLKRPHRHWTKRELLTLKRMYYTAGPAATAKMLRRSKSSIYNTAVRTGLMHEREVWSPREDALLRKYAPTMTAWELSAKVGWTKKQVLDRCFR